MYQFKRIGENEYMVKARWVKLYTFKIIWSNDKKLPVADFTGLRTYTNSYKDFTYRVDMQSIIKINKKLQFGAF